MKPRVMYIEKKTEGSCPLDGKGPSMIKEVTFSKSGMTVYCNGKKYRRANLVYGNFYCPEDQSQYWITGIKEDGTNRLTSTEKSQKHERKRWMNGG